MPEARRAAQRFSSATRGRCHDVAGYGDGCELVPARSPLSPKDRSLSSRAPRLRGARRADRLRAPPAEEDDLRPQDPASGPAAGNHRAIGGPRASQRPNSHADAAARGHGAHLAGPLRRWRPACPGRPRAVRPAGLVHRAAGCRGQDAGLSVTRRDRRAAVALVVSGAGPEVVAHRRVVLPFHRAAPAQAGRAQALAIPVLALRARPRLPAQGRTRGASTTAPPTEGRRP